MYFLPCHFLYCGLKIGNTELHPQLFFLFTISCQRLVNLPRLASNSWSSCLSFLIRWRGRGGKGDFTMFHFEDGERGQTPRTAGNI